MICVGIDIGGTKCAVSLAICEDSSIEIISKSKFPTYPQPDTSPDETLNHFLSDANKLLAAEGFTWGDISGIGISCGGPLNSAKGVILSPPNLPGWDEIRVVEFFENNTGVKTVLQNDANACAIAEWKFGAGIGCDNMVFLTFGTGLGAGIIANGQLISGASDMAGEIGHVRLTADGPVGYGKKGSAEGWCSGGGIAQIGAMFIKEELSKGNEPELYIRSNRDFSGVTAKLIGDMADEGDELSLAIYRRAGKMLGITLSILIDILNPSRIILGGIFVKSSHLLMPDVNRVISSEALKYASGICEILPAALGDRIGDYAALALACGINR